MEDSKKRSMYLVGLSEASSARVFRLALFVFASARVVSLSSCEHVVSLVHELYSFVFGILVLGVLHSRTGLVCVLGSSACTCVLHVSL